MLHKLSLGKAEQAMISVSSNMWAAISFLPLQKNHPIVLDWKWHMLSAFGFCKIYHIVGPVAS